MTSMHGMASQNAFHSAPAITAKEDLLKTERWNILKKCILGVFFDDVLPGNEVLYGHAEDLMADYVQRKRSPAELVSVIKDSIRLYSESAVQELSGLDDGQGWERGLRVVARIWTRFTTAMRMLRNIFDGLESQFMVTRAPEGADSLWNLGVNVFRDIVTQGSVPLCTVVKLVLLALNAYRSSDLALRRDNWEAEPVCQTLLVALQMFSLLDIYDSYLEKAIISDAFVFYTNQGQDALKMTNLAEYLCELERRSHLEVVLGKHVKESTADCLICISKEKLLRDHVETLLDKPRLVELIQKKDIVAVRRVYRLFNEINQQAIRAPWNAYIKEKGASLLGLDDGSVVEHLIEFKDQLQTIRESCFCDEVNFSPKEAFESFLNQDPSRAAMLLASHFGGLLDDELTKHKLRVAMDLFRYIQAKDIFEAYYKKDLHRRLLSKIKVSEQEIEVVDALRLECGPGFTAKIEGMIRDMHVSQDSAEEYQHHMTVEGGAFAQSIGFTPVTLTTGFWPSLGANYVDWTTSICQVGNQMARLQETFTKMYLAKHDRRTLKWIPSWGTCVVRTVFQPGNKKDLLLSHAQACILFHFQNVDTLTFEQLWASSNGMSESDKKKVIQSLCLQKNLKVLLKSTKTKNIESGQRFTFNTAFKSAKSFITLNNPPVLNTKEDLKQTEERVQEDRQFELDAMIVRMMKSRRSMTHNDLMGEVLKLAAFRPQPGYVKKRLESLIARDYITRDPNVSDQYHYVA
eukprot:GEMP01023437.1.p1 GENE.GEMP01023437.1~~GEMP01023437.1.p1  ORF type:complete len:784 (+),score=122.28 GEMP01023437.1:123-2354(+)